MKSLQLQESLNKAIEKVNKIQNTLTKHEIKAGKMLADIEKKGYDVTNAHAKWGTPEHNEHCYAIMDYDNKLDDIKECSKKLRDARVAVANWQEKLDRQLQLENVYDNEMPKVFRECKEMLTRDWTVYDIIKRENMLVKRRELSYKEFREIYTHSQEYDLNISDEQIEKRNSREAELWIIDLWNRVKAITGEVTDYSGINFRGKALNGYIKGVDGSVEVETITAGGYNIQRLHLRVLVKKIG